MIEHHTTDCETPFGPIALPIVAAHGRRAALLHDQIDPRGAIYAAKSSGLQRVIEVVSAAPLDRLLAEPGAPWAVVPHDAVDLTIGRAATFFVDKGYGFLGQQQLFCPELRAAAIAALADRPGRSFTRGVLAVTDQPAMTLDPRWGAQLIARSGVPAAYLAKELELCYTPLCALAPLDDLDALLDALLATLPDQRSCPCATAMQATRERGLVGDDWRGWL
jgi:5'-methylthioadenosine phosphorylase